MSLTPLKTIQARCQRISLVVVDQFAVSLSTIIHPTCVMRSASIIMVVVALEMSYPSDSSTNRVSMASGVI